MKTINVTRLIAACVSIAQDRVRKMHADSKKEIAKARKRIERALSEKEQLLIANFVDRNWPKNGAFLDFELDPEYVRMQGDLGKGAQGMVRKAV